MLKGDHIVLRYIAADDLPALHRWINDRELVLFNAPYKPVSDFEQQRWFEAIGGRNDIFAFGIRSLEGDKLIGSCQLLNVSFIHRSADLQIRLGDRAEQGLGYGTEAVQLLLDFGFKDLNLNRICLHVFKTNMRAIRSYEKVGFVKEGLLRKGAHIDGKYIDIVVMGILREEYGK